MKIVAITFIILCVLVIYCLARYPVYTFIFLGLVFIYACFEKFILKK